MGTNYCYQEIRQDRIHIGKRSGGWLFCWDFNDDEHFSTRHSLVHFIRGGGTIVCDYGYIWDIDDFLTMAVEWGQPRGRISDDDMMITGVRVCSPSNFFIAWSGRVRFKTPCV